MIAAWASVEAAGANGSSPAALANLALLLADNGRHRAALEMWRRVRWGERAGIGEGTVAYYTGLSYEALGDEDKALEAYRQAAGSAATTFTDDGPAVGPAAEDHLADLGVATEGSPTAR